MRNNMKKIFVTLALGLMGWGAAAVYAQQSVEIDTLLNQMDQDGKKFGYWEERQGRNVYKGRYVDNIKEGQWVKLSSSKLALRIENYKHGKLEGYLITFNGRGNIASRTEYREGVKHGDMYKYAQTGNNINALAHYKYGLLHGHIRKYYDNGRVQEDGYYKQGLRHGTTKWYDYQGKLVAEFRYHDGLFSGPQKTFYPNGKVKTEETAEQGVMMGERKEYYDTGKLKLKGAYSKGKRHGKWMQYSKDGSGATELIYKYGELKNK